MNTDTLTVSDILDGLGAGVVTHNYNGFRIVTRHCTECPAELPQHTIDGRWDIFPRCSAHAF